MRALLTTSKERVEDLLWETRHRSALLLLTSKGKLLLGALLLLILLLALTAGLFLSLGEGASTPSDDPRDAIVLTELRNLREAILKDPVGVSGALPSGVVRKLTAAGGGALEGTLAQRSESGTCFVMTLQVKESFVLEGAAAGLVLGSPQAGNLQACTPAASPTITPTPSS